MTDWVLLYGDGFHGDSPIRPTLISQGVGVSPSLAQRVIRFRATLVVCRPEMVFTLWQQLSMMKCSEVNAA
jgi:hypothetical protein